MAFLHHLPELWQTFKGSRAPMTTKTTAANGHTFTADTSTLPTIPHSNSIDLPHSRKMIVVQAYSPQDNRGLLVLRGESVQVISQEKDWFFVRNEKGKEGFVPSSHLLAPYSSMRTRQGSRSNPIRPVASGSSVQDLDSSRTLGMYHSHSAGRPRRMSQGNEGDGRGMRRVFSPPNHAHKQIPIATTDLSNNNNNILHHQGGGTISQQTATTSYEQKYSPSSSSGVASLNGPSSPSFTSLQESPSQENVGHHTGSSHTHSSQSSLSSMSEEDTEGSIPVRPGGEGVHPATNNSPCSSQENVHRTRATSESNLTVMKIRPLPLPPKPNAPPGMRRTQHIYSTIIGDGEEDPPPPVPPRTYLGGETGFEEYSQPADALHQERMPRFNYPRVKSLTDVRGREVKPAAYAGVSDGLYSPVFQPRSKTRRRKADFVAHGEAESAPSEGGGGSVPSRRSSSRKSGSRAHSDVVAADEQYSPRLPGSRWGGEEEMESGARTRGGGGGERFSSQNAQTRISKFRKCLWGLYIVTDDFHAMDENEVSVKKGEHVSVWNQDDCDWFWVVRHTSNSDEGFVPSYHLREIVAKDTRQQAPALESVQEGGPPRHQSLVTASHLPVPDTPPRLMRYRTGSQEMRRRPSSGGSTGRRARLNSDSSSRPTSLTGRTPSISSIEKTDIPESPPSSPPPPYTEYDHTQSRRHYSLSQQHDVLPTPYGAPMSRTRSNGHVSSPSYRVRAMGHVQPLSLPEGDPPTPPLSVLRRGGSRDFISQPDPYQLRSPTVVSGGTLV